MNSDVLRAVRSALQQGSPYLTLEEVFSYTAVPVGKQAVLESLQLLCARDQAVQAQIKGVTQYRAKQALHDLKPTAKASRKPMPNDTHRLLAQRVTALLKEQSEPIDTRQIRSALGLDTAMSIELSETLKKMEKRERIEAVGARCKGKAVFWQLRHEEPEPDAPEADDAAAPAVNDDERATEGKLNHRRFSYRSDGTLLMELPVYGPIELNRAETDTLFDYLYGVHQRIQQALEYDHDQL